MKKILLIYILILAGLGVLFSVLDQSSEYIIEKKVWQVNKQKMDIAKDPIAVPDQKYELVIRQYRDLMARYPDSRLTPGLYNSIGEIYGLKKDFVMARAIFAEIQVRYPDNRELKASALFETGRTYEVEGNWVKANEIYQNIIEEYPLTEVGLNVPLYIANFYRKQNDYQGTVGAYEVAIRLYSTIARVHEGTRHGLKALRNLASCYLEQKRWDEAIKELGTVLEKYATTDYLTPQSAEITVKTINITAGYKLKNYDAAIKLYEGILERNPGHPLEAYLNKVISAFNQLKEMNYHVADH